MDSLEIKEYSLKHNANSRGYATVHAVNRGLIAASAECEYFDNGLWLITRVVVLEGRGPARGAGLGSELLQRMMKLAENAGAKRIMVTPGGYSADRDRQNHFYEKNGFIKTNVGYYIWFIDERVAERRKTDRRVNAS